MQKKPPRFPIPRYPTSWFQIGYSDEVKPGDVKPLAYFGEQLVLYRTESGELHLLDAFCPHLGAHLGHGGKIKGEEIECPFHAWRFNGQGKCTAVPYAKRIPAKAAIRPWHLAERNGQIYAWHDVDGREPFFEIPDVPEFTSDEFSDQVRREWKFRTHNQEMAENVVDSAHFKYVHGTEYQPATRIEHEGPLLHMVSPLIVKVAGNEIPGQVESHTYGFGFAVTRFTGMAETLVTGNVTPIDDEYVHVRFTFTVRKMGGHDVTKGIGRAFVKEISRQLEEDAPIWENKVYHPVPTLCDGDGPVGLFRRWTKQFYPEWYVKEAEEAFRAAHAPSGAGA